MAVNANTEGNKLDVELTDELTMFTVSALKDDIFGILGQDQINTVELKMESITEFDSAGLQLLMMVEKSVSQADGSFSISSVSESVRNVLDLVGLYDKWVSADGDAEESSEDEAALDDVNFSELE